jgi:hypothetical protein
MPGVVRVPVRKLADGSRQLKADWLWAAAKRYAKLKSLKCDRSNVHSIAPL